MGPRHRSRLRVRHSICTTSGGTQAIRGVSRSSCCCMAGLGSGTTGGVFCRTLPERSTPWPSTFVASVARTDRTCRPKSSPTEGHYAADVLALLDHLEAERCIIVGHDIGAVVAQAVARQRPGRVSVLVLGNPSYPGVGGRRYEASAQSEMWYQHLHVLPWSHRLISHDRATVELYLSHFYDHWAGRKESVRPEEFRAIVETFARPGAIKASLGWYRARDAERARRGSTYADTPAKIMCPTVVLWGELDPVFPPEWSDRLREFFPNLVGLRRLSGVGHFVPFEAPEEMLKAIRDAHKVSII